MNNYCLGQIVQSCAEFEALVEKHQEQYNYFEIWIDYIKDFDLSFLEKQIAKLSNRLIVLLRTKDEDPYQKSEEERLETIKFLTNHSLILDLDYNQKKELEVFYQSNQKLKLLLSFHDYKSTASYVELNMLIKEMLKKQAYIYKIACFCHNQSDAINLLQLHEYYSREVKRLIVLGAGEQGLITRLAALINKQEIIYAPFSKKDFVVPGQVTLDQYIKLQEILEI